MASFEPGRRYRVNGVIGEGGMGTVYRAHDLELDRPVVMKVPKLQLLGAEGEARFLREARVLASLESDRVVRVYEVARGPCPFMVQELLEGEGLDVRMTRGLLSPEEGRRLAEELAEGLGVLHENGIVHRDVKPDNLFLRRDGSLCLLDFGLATSSELTRLTRTGDFVGSLPWLPPEVFRGEEATATSDVYQAGLVVHAACAGHPLDRSPMAEWSELIRLGAGTTEPSEPDPSLPADLRAWIRAACRWERKERGFVSLGGGAAPKSLASPSHPSSSSSTSSFRGGTRFEGLLFLALSLLVLAGLFLASGRDRTGSGNEASALLGGFRAVPLPDGVVMCLDVAPVVRVRWRCADGTGRVEEGGFTNVGGRWAGVFAREGLVYPVTVDLVVEGDRQIFQRRIASPDSFRVADARFSEGGLYLGWSFMPDEALEVLAASGETPLRSRGRHRGRCALHLGERGKRGRQRVRWELRLAGLPLSQGELEGGFVRRAALGPSRRGAGGRPWMAGGLVTRGGALFVRGLAGDWLSVATSPSSTGVQVDAVRPLLEMGPRALRRGRGLRTSQLLGHDEKETRFLVVDGELNLIRVDSVGRRRERCLSRRALKGVQVIVGDGRAALLCDEEGGGRRLHALVGETLDGGLPLDPSWGRILEFAGDVERVFVLATRRSSGLVWEEFLLENGAYRTGGRGVLDVEWSDDEEAWKRRSLLPGDDGSFLCTVGPHVFFRDVGGGAPRPVSAEVKGRCAFSHVVAVDEKKALLARVVLRPHSNVSRLADLDLFVLERRRPVLQLVRKVYDGFLMPLGIEKAVGGGIRVFGNRAFLRTGLIVQVVAIGGAWELVDELGIGQSQFEQVRMGNRVWSIDVHGDLYTVDLPGFEG